MIGLTSDVWINGTFNNNFGVKHDNSQKKLQDNCGDTS